VADIEVEGIEALARALATDLGPTLVAHEIQDRMADYPPESAANDSGQRRWYERGRGGFYRRKDGSVQQSSSSETLGRRWQARPNSGGATLRNLASYSAYVHDHKRQTGFHAERGWKTDKGVADAVERDGTVEEIATAAIEKALGLP
jgi:hypothetical protein